MAFNNPYVEWEDIDNPPTEFPTTWGDIADKPTSYPATWGNLADIPEWWPNSLEWSSLTNIPNVWPNGLKPGSITETEILDGSIKSPKIAAYAVTAGKMSTDALDFWVAQGMRLISSLIETTSIVNRGIKLTSNYLKAWNNSGVETFSLDAATGLLTVKNVTVNNGTITGAKFVQQQSGSPNNTVTIENRELVFTRDDEGSPVPTTVLGGSDGDEIKLYNTDGDVAVSLSGQTGVAAFTQVEADNILLSGEALKNILSELAGGVVAYGSCLVNGNTVGVSTTSSPRSWMELGEIRFSVKTGRAYQVSVMPIGIYVPAGAYAYLKCSYRTGSNPSKPIVGDSVLSYICINRDLSDRSMTSLGGTFGFVPNSTTTYRVLFYIEFWSASAAASATTFDSSTNTLDVVVTDLGYPDASNAVTKRSATNAVPEPTPPPPVAKTYTTTYDQTWFRSWRGSSTITTDLGHGYYGGYQRYSIVGFDASEIASDLSGATITKVEAYVINTHWWGSSGQIRVGSSTNTSAPSNPVTSGTTSNTTIAAGFKGWVPVGGFTTSSRSITLGVGAGTGTNTYGKFKTSGVKLRITYKK